VDESENYLRRAVELEPRNALWFADFGTAEMDLGKFRNAEAAYRQALFLSDDPRWHNGLGNALFSQGKLPAALAEYQIAVERAPRVAVFHINLGNLYAKQANWPEAERALLNGIALKPDNAGWQALLATAYFQQRKYREAEGAYKAAIRLRPTDALSYFNLGVIYLNLGDKRSAQAQLEKLKPLDARLANKLNDLIEGRTPAGH
jgi:tetratricopeptide (TPR) repeat protein